MNEIVGFGLCTLSNEVLIKEVDRQCDEMFINQKVPIRHIPARPNEDFDLLLGEVLIRLKELVEKGGQAI
jgi:hypothetical protein